MRFVSAPSTRAARKSIVSQPRLKRYSRGVLAASASTAVEALEQRLCLTITPTFAAPVALPSGTTPFPLSHGPQEINDPAAIAAAEAQASNLTPGLIFSDAVVADFSGNGNHDVALAADGTTNADGDPHNEILVYHQQSNGTYTNNDVYIYAGYPLARPSTLAVADFNGDGKLDIAVVSQGETQGSNPSANLVIFFGTGNGKFQNPSPSSSIPTLYSLPFDDTYVVTGDFNGDKKPDLAVFGLGAATLYVLTNDGTGAFTTQSIDTSLGSPGSLAVGDYNGDGKTDIEFIAGGFGGTSQVYLNTTPAPSVFTVTNTGDNGGVDPAPGAGTGTLRQAIVDANASPSEDNVIDFNIGTGVQTIELDAELPKITNPVTIDGSSESPSSSTPTVVLDGEKVLTGGDPDPSDTGNQFANPDGDGLLVFSSDVVVNDLTIENFKAPAVLSGTNQHPEAVGIHLNYPQDGFDQIQGCYIEKNNVGVNVESSQPNTIGGADPAGGNVITGNSGAGIEIESDSSNGGASSQLNEVRFNSIYGNGGLGIDLGADGFTPNTPNGSQNFPVLTSAVSNGTTTTVEGTFNSTPSSFFIIDFFSNSMLDSDGKTLQGKTYLGSEAVQTDSSGNATVDAILNTPVPSGQFVTATATTQQAMSAGQSTSEFALPVTVTGGTTSAFLKIDAGGGAVDEFAPDEDFSGGKTYSTTAAINQSALSSPVPQSVFQTERFGNFTYTIPNLTPGTTYQVNLDFAEIYWNGPNQRLFNVFINNSSTPTLSNFDIFKAAGGKNKAIVKSFMVEPNAANDIVIGFVTLKDNAKVDGIEISPAPATPPPPPPSPIKIDAGGPADASDGFLADSTMYYSGGKTYSTTAPIDTSGVPTPAPQEVYQTERFGNFTYTIPGLTAGNQYNVQLDFDEIYWNAANKRLFNVFINGSSTPVLSNFDIYAAAGGKNKAIAESFTETAQSDGTISIQFVTLKDNAKVDGIEVTPIV